MRPLIGIVPLYDTEKQSYWMLPGYMRALEACLAVPVMLPLTQDPNELRYFIRECDGLLFPGGQDVDPALYGEAIRPECGELCPARDGMEAALLDAALRLNKPVLGICRGLQFLNVHTGGTLYQDVAGHDQDGGDAPHNVALAPGSFLAGAYGAQEVRTNTFHHQAADAVAPGFAVTARAADGVIEGIERGRIIGVQWHPEASLDMPLFARFADLCRQG